MTSSLLMELKEEFHTHTDGFTARNLLPCVLVHSSCHEDITARWRNAETPLPTALSDARGQCKAADLGASLPGRPLARDPAEQNRLPCPVKVEQLN
jgi:hypothetical protein